MKIFLYGPPGSGKSAIGKCLADDLKLPFIDLDEEIEKRVGNPIANIFTQSGEAKFRSLEREELDRAIDHLEGGVISLGAGALLDAISREKAENAGVIICLTATLQTLLERLGKNPLKRPLLNGQMAEKLSILLQARADHYSSFPLQLETDNFSIQEAAWQSQIRLGHFRVDGMGQAYQVIVSRHGIGGIGKQIMDSHLPGPFMVVTDENIVHFWGDQLISLLEEAGLECHQVILPAGESTKNIQTISRLWDSFIEAHLDRQSTVIAMGGGVVTDLAGFAAATFMRGIPWIAVPTSLLGMVDASIGAKTGIDLKQGKNLAGAFYPPRLVLIFPEFLSTLPIEEILNGFAEIVKAAVIGNPDLFTTCARGWEALSGQAKTGDDWHQLISRAIAVKVRIIKEDPFEKGSRIALNLGHTIGHALEVASGYQLRHGASVAIGMVAEAKLGENLGYTEPGLSNSFAEVLANFGLPTQFPKEMDIHRLQGAIQVDKKHRTDRIKLPFPVKIAQLPEVIEIAEETLWTPFLY